MKNDGNVQNVVKEGMVANNNEDKQGGGEEE